MNNEKPENCHVKRKKFLQLFLSELLNPKSYDLFFFCKREQRLTAFYKLVTTIFDENYVDSTVNNSTIVFRKYHFSNAKKKTVPSVTDTKF